MTKTKAFLTLGAALLAAAPALAQPAPPAGPQGGAAGGPGPRGGIERMFERLDANRDGRVSWDEVWTVIQGTGYTIVDGMKQSVRPGDVITMSAGCKHTIHAESEMQLIEVKLGSEIDAADKTVYPLEGEE